MCQNVGHGKSHWDTVSFRRSNKDCTWFQFGLRHPHVAKTYCFFSGVVINDAGYNASVFHLRFYHDNNLDMYNHWNSWQPQLKSHNLRALEKWDSTGLTNQPRSAWSYFAPSLSICQLTPIAWLRWLDSKLTDYRIFSKKSQGLQSSLKNRQQNWGCGRKWFVLSLYLWLGSQGWVRWVLVYSCPWYRDRSTDDILMGKPRSKSESWWI